MTTALKKTTTIISTLSRAKMNTKDHYYYQYSSSCKNEYNSSKRLIKMSKQRIRCTRLHYCLDYFTIAPQKEQILKECYTQIIVWLV